MVSTVTIAIAVFVVFAIGSAWLVRRTLKGDDGVGSGSPDKRSRRRQSKGARRRE